MPSIAQTTLHQMLLEDCQRIPTCCVWWYGYCSYVDPQNVDGLTNTYWLRPRPVFDHLPTARDARRNCPSAIIFHPTALRPVVLFELHEHPSEPRTVETLEPPLTQFSYGALFLPSFPAFYQNEAFLSPFQFCGVVQGIFGVSVGRLIPVGG